MPSTKCCGTCGWGYVSKTFPESPFIQCDAPLPVSVPHKAKGAVVDGMGTDCDCWKPKEGEDESA